MADERVPVRVDVRLVGDQGAHAVHRGDLAPIGGMVRLVDHGEEIALVVFRVPPGPVVLGLLKSIGMGVDLAQNGRVRNAVAVRSGADDGA